jgi:hypothetical protein
VACFVREQHRAISDNVGQKVYSIRLVLKDARLDGSVVEEYAPAADSKKKVAANLPLVDRAGHGLVQETFERLAKDTILEKNYPLQTYDIVEEFAERGHPLGGTREWKTASNRLWQAKARGVFQRIPNVGYWPADVPYCPKKNVRPPEDQKRPHSRHGLSKPNSDVQGRPPALTSEQQERVDKMRQAGKSVTEITEALGGIVSKATIYYVLKAIEKQRALEAAEKAPFNVSKSIN